MNHPDRRTGYVAWQIGQIMAARMERALRPLQLTLAQHRALMQAVLDPGVSSATAARRAAITPQSMGTAVNGLVERGMLERRTTPGDRRTQRLHVTEAACTARRGGRGDGGRRPRRGTSGADAAWSRSRRTRCCSSCWRR